MIHEKFGSNVSNFISTIETIEAVVRVAKPDFESVDDGEAVPLSNLVIKTDVVWKCNKRFKKLALKKCSLTEDGIKSNNLENP